MISPVSRMQLQAFFLFSFFLAVLSAEAKSERDSVPQGVIRIRRPGIQAAYRVHLEYTNPDSGRSDKRVTQFNFGQIVFGDSIFNPLAPQPFADFQGQSVPFRDSIAYARHENETAYPPVPFEWQNYLARMHYQFNWGDSLRSDSARFIYSLDTKGHAICKPLPWPGESDRTTAFEKKSIPFLTALELWYPARKRRNPKRKTSGLRPIPCVVIVTVYAFDPYAGRLMPIEDLPIGR